MALESIRRQKMPSFKGRRSAVSSSDPDLKNDTGDDAGEDSVLIDAPYTSQLGTYPTGCESVSAVISIKESILL